MAKIAVRRKKVTSRRKYDSVDVQDFKEEVERDGPILLHTSGSGKKYFPVKGGFYSGDLMNVNGRAVGRPVIVQTKREQGFPFPSEVRDNARAEHWKTNAYIVGPLIEGRIGDQMYRGYVVQHHFIPWETLARATIHNTRK